MLPLHFLRPLLIVQGCTCRPQQSFVFPLFVLLFPPALCCQEPSPLASRHARDNDHFSGRRGGHVHAARIGFYVLRDNPDRGDYGPALRCQ